MAKVRATRRRAERRASTRADARLSMRVDGARAEGERAHVVTESQNISASGVYCRSTHYLAPLSKVDLTIVLPKLPGGRGAKELIKCEGIVVRCSVVPGKRSDRTADGYELACMFSDLDARRRGLLEEFVTWRNLQALRAAANGAAPARPARRRPVARAAAAGATRVARASSATRRTTGTRRRTR